MKHAAKPMVEARRRVHVLPGAPVYGDFQIEWEGLRRELSSAAFAKKAARARARMIPKIKDLLAQCIEAGATILDAADRANLQWMAREMGDAVFRLGGGYPQTAIQPPVGVERVQPPKVLAVRAPVVSIARLPATGRDLFGRERELAWLDACWKDGVHVASVVAWGGVGKSALVNAWLARLRDDGWRGAARVFGWSFFSQGTDRLMTSDEFVDTALRWFGDPDPAAGSPWDKGERLAGLVRAQRAVLILDGLEALQWGPGVEQGKLKDVVVMSLVKELGAQNKGLCLITSRIGVADLEPLAGDKVRELELAHLLPEAGAELLRARGAEGADEELREVAREYDGHGLALSLLGSYLRKAHQGDVRKGDLIPALEGRPAQRMMATYERWFAGRPEMAILRMLGLFDRPASGDEIAALREKPPIPGLTDTLTGLSAPAWNGALTTLRDVGLLAVEAGKDVIDAHPLVREHFGEQLKREQPDAWREGHRRLYGHLKGKAKALPETLEEMAPLYAAVVHGCRAGLPEDALDSVYMERILRREQDFSLKKLGAHASEVAVLSAFFDPPWEGFAPGLDERAQFTVASRAAFILQEVGRLTEALGLKRLVLARHTARGAWGDAALAGAFLSDLLRVRGQLPEAAEAAQQGVEHADKSGGLRPRVLCRTTLALVLHAMGDPDRARQLHEEAQQAVQADPSALLADTDSWILSIIADFWYRDILLALGRESEVLVLAARSLEWSRAQRFLVAMALDHLALGRAHLLGVQRGTGGDLGESAAYFQQAVDGLRRTGSRGYQNLGLLSRAALRIHTGALSEARRDIDEAFTFASRCGFRLDETDAHLAYARLALATADLTSARAHLAQARALIDATSYHRRDADLAELEAAAR